ncbi:MAG: purine-nucleoside phosphorylase [Anaerolineae bacterium]|nr:purine-nucleoside phosphorylase [Anaerolineae bacterium]
MADFLSYAHIEAAASTVRERIHVQPRVGLILGSGLNPLADAIEESVAIPYADIPHFPRATVEGHVGRLVIGRLEGQPLIAMQGRAHYYEGYSMAEVTFPIRVMQVLGIEILIVTNAAGGLNPTWQVGDVMIITDHIALVCMMGANPLRGPNIDELGVRFPDMSEAYDAHLRALARQAALGAGVPVREGVYVGLAGPNFETPAEVRFLRLIGADAVGMSTVAEVIVARHGNTRVLGLSGISNVLPAEGAPTAKTSHIEVLESGKLLVPRLESVIRGVLRAL